MAARSGGAGQPKLLIVFDMDGVIADVSRSYRDTVRQTARLFFRPAPRWRELPSPLFPLSDLARLKQSGNLNNDWDLSCRTIELLMTRLPALPAHGEPPPGDPRDPWDRHRETMRRCDLGPLIRHLRGSSHPLSDLLLTADQAEDPFVRSLYRGDVGSGNVIKQIFQEVYLGARLFTRTYGIPPRMYSGPGYNEREKLMAPPDLLGRLAGRHVLAIATGRPAAEAHHFLSRYSLIPLFRKVVTLDDCLREQERILAHEGKTVSLSKPNPFMLDAIARELIGEAGGCCYVGDLPDDMEAARRSGYGFRAVGLLQAAADRDALRADLERAGADSIAEDFSALARMFLPA
jgi:phosphoglycolate phosphatase-like HAD superfamily hydrolase